MCHPFFSCCFFFVLSIFLSLFLPLRYFLLKRPHGTRTTTVLYPAAKPFLRERRSCSECLSTRQRWKIHSREWCPGPNPSWKASRGGGGSRGTSWTLLRRRSSNPRYGPTKDGELFHLASHRRNYKKTRTNPPLLVSSHLSIVFKYFSHPAQSWSSLLFFFYSVFPTYGTLSVRNSTQAF